MHNSKRVLAILDTELDYGNSLMNYLNKMNSELQISVFSYLDSLNQFLSLNPVDILLISDDKFIDDLNCEAIKKIVLLVGADNKVNHRGLEEIKKYQPASMLYKELRLLCADLGACLPEVTKDLNQDNLNLIIVCSFEGGSGLYETAFELIGNLKEGEKALLMDFRMFSTKSDVIADNNGLTDMLYYLKERKDNFILKFHALIKEQRGLDYLGPVDYILDLCEITIEDVNFLAEQLMKFTDYNQILVCIDYFNFSVFELFRLSRIVYLVQAVESELKTSAFIKQLKKMEEHKNLNLSSKIKVISSRLSERTIE